MNNKAPLENLKMKLSSHAEFNEAWDLLTSIGYSGEKPYSCPYLYAHEDGRLLYDFFDVEGADLTSPNTAQGYFTSHPFKEVTLEEMKLSKITVAN